MNTQNLADPQRPQLETQERNVNPRDSRNQEPVVLDMNADDVRFVLDIFRSCLAETAAKGGDTRYAAINCFEIARQALGVACAYGIIVSHSRLENGEALFRNPAVPPEGQKPVRHSI
ncbi:MAG: hypothetical protein ACYCPT_02050 [Acidimicrobiales bacterium]